MEKAVNHKILNLICCSYFNERNSRLALKDLLYYFCNEEAFYRVYDTFVLNDKNHVIKMFHGARNQLFFINMTNPFDKKDDLEIVSLISLIRLKYALFLNDEIKSILNVDEIEEIYQKFEGQNKKARYKMCRQQPSPKGCF